VKTSSFTAKYPLPLTLPTSNLLNHRSSFLSPWFWY